MFPGLAMHLFPQRAEFQHLACDHNAALRVHPRQCVYHRVQRLRIRIVAIVDDRDVTQLENLPALVGGLERRQCRNRLRETHAARARHRNRRQRIQNVVLSHQRQPRVVPPARAHHVELGSFRALRHHILRPHFCRGLGPVRNHFPLVVAPELRNVLIVSVQNGCPCGRERFDQLVFRPRDSRKRIEKLEVDRRHVGHHSNFGLRDLRQRANFPRVRHPHLDHRQVVLRFQFQKHQRQPEMIVEVAF